MLQLNDVLLKRGEQTVFDNAGLTVHAGHVAGVVGRNGAGKTTLFELVRGRLLPEDGEVAAAAALAPGVARTGGGAESPFRAGLHP